MGEQARFATHDFSNDCNCKFIFLLHCQTSCLSFLLFTHNLFVHWLTLTQHVIYHTVWFKETLHCGFTLQNPWLFTSIVFPHRFSPTRWSSYVYFFLSLQVIIVSSYPVRPVIPARMEQCVWRSWIRTISLWVSAVIVAGASLAPAVKSMWMSAAPAPVFTASAMMVRNSLSCQHT